MQEKLYSNEIMVAVQEMVKEHVDRVPLEPADTDVTFLVVHWEGHIWLHKYIAKHVEVSSTREVSLGHQIYIGHF
ncbi:hypothetical protein PAHAL_6G269300 [Panicum hallii]|uniref:Uncharacterized protein n=1 Tax=Panicum hallii TaxID=206008 RepID=A0A2T8IHS0_9POAL|nr:hypothetical protein PAHAL_6G269300 [Panicum hallii]